jgi:hypothetical protein
MQFFHKKTGIIIMKKFCSGMLSSHLAKRPTADPARLSADGHP